MSTKSVPLSSLKVVVRGNGFQSVERLQQDVGFTILLASLPLSTLVYHAGAVIGSLEGELINVGSYVQFSAGPGEVGLQIYISVHEFMFQLHTD